MPWLLLVIHASYELSLAMVSFMKMSSCYWYAYIVMQCFVVSGMSSRSCYHSSAYAMLCFSAKSETVNKSCYVYMGAIISSVPFWLMISKGLLFYVFSRIMPCLYLLWYVLVAGFWRKYALEAIIKLLFTSLFYDKCLLFMLELY